MKNPRNPFYETDAVDTCGLCASATHAALNILVSRPLESLNHDDINAAGSILRGVVDALRAAAEPTIEPTSNQTMFEYAVDEFEDGEWLFRVTDAGGADVFTSLESSQAKANAAGAALVDFLLKQARGNA